MLTPLQHRVRQIVASVPGTEDLVLAGGAALILRGIVDRPTLDLDFFATSPEEVDRLLPRVERALRDEGLTVKRVQVSEGFRWETGCCRSLACSHRANPGRSRDGFIFAYRSPPVACLGPTAWRR